MAQWYMHYQKEQGFIKFTSLSPERKIALFITNAYTENNTIFIENGINVYYFIVCYLRASHTKNMTDSNE